MKNIKRPLSLLLLIALVLPLFQLVGVEGLTANAEEKSILEGKPVYSHYAYHDTWTGDWEGYTLDPIAGKGNGVNGSPNYNNENKSYDRGNPLSMQSSTISLELSAFNVTSLEEFKNKFTVVPLTPQALMNMGLSAEEADTFIGKAVSPSMVTGGISTGDVKAFKKRYASLSVTDYTINNDGIKLAGDNVVIPLSYRLATENPVDGNPEAPWGIDMRDRVLNPTDGMIVNINMYKSAGKGYEEFREHQMKYFSAPEDAIRSLWDNGMVNPGAVGWRWYMPFTVLQKETLKDLNVTELTVDIDEPTGDITCEASVENSFTENLKNVQLQWILETPKGTI